MQCYLALKQDSSPQQTLCRLANRYGNRQTLEHVDATGHKAVSIISRQSWIFGQNAQNTHNSELLPFLLEPEDCCVTIIEHCLAA